MHWQISISLLLLFSIPPNVFGDTLLTPEMAQSLAKATAVESAAIAEMRYTPMHIRSDNTQFYAKLSSEEREKLMTYLTSAKNIDPAKELLGCTFLPGASFDFYRPREAEKDSPQPDPMTERDRKLIATVALCFNCNVWAIAMAEDMSESESKRNPYLYPQTVLKVLRYGDFRKDRDSILHFIKTIPSLVPVAKEVEAPLLPQ